MSKDQLRKLQLLQLKIAQEIKRICEKNDIQYFLDCGSMLGAVRHHGFIPWDDDMDIGFSRIEYERFLEAAKKDISDEFYLLTWDVDEAYPQPYAKFCLKGTVYREGIHKGKKESIEQGIFVDLFPYDHLSDKAFYRYINGFCRKIISHILMIKSGYQVWNGKGILKKIKFSPIIFISFFCNRNILKKCFLKLACGNNAKNTKELGIEDGGISLNWKYSRDTFRNFIMVDFENDKFPIPENYDDILKKMYGNYLEYPPENQRYIGHTIQKLDFGIYL